MFGCTYTDCIKSIKDMKNRWMTVIPSSSCDNRSIEGKCLWHTNNTDNDNNWTAG